jgi:hypothetical protein
VNIALEALRRAKSAGFTFVVTFDGDVTDYQGDNVNAAWRAIVDCTEIMTVIFFDENGTRRGFLETTAHGLDIDENIVDCSSAGPIADICDAVCSL